MKIIATLSAIPLLAACNGGESQSSSPAESGDPAAGTRPAGEPRLVTKTGRIENGTECSILHTPDGERWAFNAPEADFSPGDYVEITGEIADASFCMEGEGTLIVRRIDPAEPPARDRDPARAGGVALTEEYVVGRWAAKGAAADCDRPDFEISTNRNGMAIIETRVNGVPTTAPVGLSPEPAFRFERPLPNPKIEARGPDGLAVLAPPSGEITIAGHPITGDGVVFVRCA